MMKYCVVSSASEPGNGVKVAKNLGCLVLALLIVFV